MKMVVLALLALCLIAVSIAGRCRLGIHNLPDPDDAWRAGWATRTTEARCLRCGRWFSLGYKAWRPSAAQVDRELLAVREWSERKDREAARKVETWINRGGQKRVVELPLPAGLHVSNQVVEVEVLEEER